MVKDKNPKDVAEKTPLHSAAERGHTEIVKMILNVAEDKNPKDKNGNTPLSLAKHRGHLDVSNIISNAI